jgi:Cys-tRNA(Pro) deacylase
MSKQKLPSTPALRALRAANVTFDTHAYRYEERGGTRASSRELGVPEHAVIKTLLLEDDSKKPLVVLMHGDLQVSTRNLARRLGVKAIQPCDPQVAQRHSGYQVGGTSPFGLRSPLPIYAEETIRDLETLYINAGARGLLVSLSPSDLDALLSPTWVQVGIEG